jgi:signal transduction histidine kinase
MLTAQREFVADASHQLRTPLTALRLRMGEARAVGVSDEASAELDAGAAEIDRLAAIVEELLLLSRAEDRTPAVEEVDLRDAVRRAADRWGTAARTEGIDLNVSEDGDATVVCSAADLDRALDALVENAVRYSGAGGEVTISSSRGRIEVRDRGPGLAPGEESEVFERFHRGRAGRQGPPGSGLGLATARALARGWGGEARLANRDDGGGAVATLEFKETS